jgi:hypothetical protein
VRRLLLAALFLEIGLALLVLPWTSYWEHNAFAHWVPALRTVITNDFVRGGVSGLGMLNLAAAAAEFVSVFVSREVRPPLLVIDRSSPAED